MSCGKPTPRFAHQARQRGQTLVEYALILAFLSVVSILVLTSLGTKVIQVYSTVNNRLVVEPAEEPPPPEGGLP